MSLLGLILILSTERARARKVKNSAGQNMGGGGGCPALQSRAQGLRLWCKDGALRVRVERGCHSSHSHRSSLLPPAGVAFSATQGHEFQRCLLSAAYCSLLVAYCLLRAPCCLLLVAGCLLLAACSCFKALVSPFSP